MITNQIRKVIKIRKKVEKFHKETSEYEIDLIAGIIPDPPDPYPNAIFYLSMESTEKDTGKKQKPQPIWLTLGEMVKLSVLMTMASQFWLERLEKKSRYSKERIEAFREAWNQVSEAINDLEL